MHFTTCENHPSNFHILLHNKSASILFMDSPVGTGYSYGTTTHAKYTGDFKASRNLNEFLRKVSTLHIFIFENSK